MCHTSSCTHPTARTEAAEPELASVAVEQSESAETQVPQPV